MRGAEGVVLLGVEAQDVAGRGAAGAAGALVAEAWLMRPMWRVAGRSRASAGDAGEAAVDDGGDAVDGDGALGDVGGEDDFALRWRARRRGPDRRG